MLNVGDLRARSIQTGLHGQRRKAAIMLAPVQALFGYGKRILPSCRMAAEESA